MDIFDHKTVCLASVAGVLGLFLAVYSFTCVVYNLFFHPLAQVPGPMLWRASRLLFIRSLLSGNLPIDSKKIHQKYGDIVRIAPDEVSFARHDMWRDIFVGQDGHQPLPKNPTFWKAPPGQPDNLAFTSDPAASTRMRSVAMPAFTERALARQEPIMQAYVSLLVEKLSERASAAKIANQKAVINVMDYFNWLAFDLVGQLALGEDFGCLKETELHQWVAILFSSMRAMALAAATRYYAGLESILMYLIPASVRKAQTDHYSTARDKIHRRMLAEDTKRDDFMTPMLGENNPNFKNMSLPEVESTMVILLLAGSETTATALCGTFNYLTHNPAELRKLEQEIRGVFKREEDMTLRALQNLPFLNAVVSEGLRMCTPVPTGLFRIVPKGSGGATVCGVFLPEGTHVLANFNVMSFSEKSFYRAGDFLPDRFLPDGARPAEFDNDSRYDQKPFGAGSRACPGKGFALAEMRLVLARVVWRFEVSTAPGKQVDWNELKTYILVEKVPIEIVIKERPEASSSH
ncbi:cytochrome P450 [Podospora didyma]|uniref:Cytochrome P450 n=1 Tax=Podospora didyma TaxID=330526 RepID=A0AAE0P770_9PEZI|nr:cytochrome P450 [Podospora didyma]